MPSPRLLASLLGLMSLGACAAPSASLDLQSAAEPEAPLDTAANIEQRGGVRQTYVALQAPALLVIDGKLDESAWQAAVPTYDFVDIEGAKKPAPRQATRARMLWDDQYFYIGAELDETDLWATLTERDSIIFHDNDFEVFIDPDGDTHLYYELEINGLGTEWDLVLVKPYRDGGPALHGFDTHGLKSAVHLRGTLNDRRDRDTGWTLEIAIPWAALAPLTSAAVPPNDGDVWWVNFSRVEWLLDPAPEGKGYVKRKAADGGPLPESNWVWSPQGVIAMHEPESWGLVQFSRGVVTESDGGTSPGFTPPADLAARQELRDVYHLEHAFHRSNGRYTSDLHELGIETNPGQRLHIELTPSGFEATYLWKVVFEGDVRAAHSLWIRADGKLGHLVDKEVGGSPER